MLDDAARRQIRSATASAVANLIAAEARSVESHAQGRRAILSEEEAAAVRHELHAISVLVRARAGKKRA